MNFLRNLLQGKEDTALIATLPSENSLPEHPVISSTLEATSDVVENTITENIITPGNSIETTKLSKKEDVHSSAEQCSLISSENNETTTEILKQTCEDLDSKTILANYFPEEVAIKPSGYNLDILDDPNFNPFVTRSGIRNSPPPSVTKPTLTPRKPKTRPQYIQKPSEIDQSPTMGKRSKQNKRIKNSIKSRPNQTSGDIEIFEPPPKTESASSNEKEVESTPVTGVEDDDKKDILVNKPEEDNCDFSVVPCLPEKDVGNLQIEPSEQNYEEGSSKNTIIEDSIQSLTVVDTELKTVLKIEEREDQSDESGVVYGDAVEDLGPRFRNSTIITSGVPLDPPETVLSSSLSEINSTQKLSSKLNPDFEVSVLPESSNSIELKSEENVSAVDLMSREAISKLELMPKEAIPITPICNGDLPGDSVGDSAKLQRVSLENLIREEALRVADELSQDNNNDFNHNPMNQSEAGPEIATGLTQNDLKCASKFLKDEHIQMTKSLGSSFDRILKLNDDLSLDASKSAAEDYVNSGSPPREERSAPEGTSSPDPRALEGSETKVSHNNHMKSSDVSEMLEKQELFYNEKLHEQSMALAEKDTIHASLQTELEHTQLALRETTASRDAVLKLVEQYKGMLSTLVADKEKNNREQQQTVKKIQAERDQALEDVANVEAAFADVHKKYERTKQIVETLRRNEETLKNAITENQNVIKKQEKRLVEIQAQADEKLQEVHTEYENLERSTDQEMTKMAALLKKAELKIISLQDALDRKSRENQELTQLCDDLISKVGS